MAHAALDRVGMLVVEAPIALLIGWWLLQHPAVGLGLLVGTVLVFEDDAEGFLPGTHHFYNRLPHIPLSPTDALLVALIAAVVVDRGRRRLPLRMPGPFVGIALLIGAAVAGGIVVGQADGWNSVQAFNSARSLTYLIVLPVLVANVLDSPDALRRFALGAGGLIAFKGAEGSLAWLAGLGRQVGTGHLTYYEPLANAAMMAFVVAMVAAIAARVPIPRWALAAAPVAGAALLLSYRRSFWLATAVACVIAVLVASGRRGRPFVVFSGAVVIVAIYMAVSFGGATESQNTVVARVTSLSPSSLKGNAEDRYRLDEQRNVFEDIRRHPVAGLGFGVPWTIRYPLSQHFQDEQNYTHVVAFWWWLKMGLLGIVAYLASVAVGIWAGYRLWRAHPAPWGRIIGVAIAASLVGLAVAETTGSFTGVDLRFTVGLATAWGAMAAALNGIEPGVAARR